MFKLNNFYGEFKENSECELKIKDNCICFAVYKSGDMVWNTLFAKPAYGSIHHMKDSAIDSDEDDENDNDSDGDMNDEELITEMEKALYIQLSNNNQAN